MQNRTIEPYVAPVFSPPPYAVAVNALFFASLAVVLVAAVLCMLVKGWIRELDRKLRRIPDLRKRAVIKELREQGMLRWWLPQLITILPSLLVLSLLLFFIGLTVYLFYIHQLPAFLSISIFGIGLFMYMLSVSISAVDEFSPFRSSYSRALGDLYRRLYSRLAGSIGPHLTMALPQTTIEKIRERVITFIQEHIPLSEQTILELSSSSSDEIISRTSVPIINKLFSSIADWDASVYSKNISAGILFQLDDLNLRSPGIWPFLRHYDTNNLSIKEAECLAYSICMQDHNLYNLNWRAVAEVLDQSLDPWFRLVASLLWVRCINDLRCSVPARETDILHAISNTEHLTTDKWCFTLSAISALFPRGQVSFQQIRVFARILARLLQKRVYYVDRTVVEGNGATDLWLYTMTSILDKRFPAAQIRVTSAHNRFLHARDIDALVKGMTRDPSCIRRLLHLSRESKLDPSLMGSCLVSIVFILLRLSPSNQQEIRLVNQYLEIINEEMDVAAWSFALAEFFINQHSWPHGMSRVVLCLLQGRYTDLAGSYFGDYSRLIMSEYDLRLSAAGTEPTTSILEVLNYVISLSPIIGLQLQNAWLSLYANNRTRSPHTSALPLAWSSDCASIASGRLSLYDSGLVTPEIDLVVFFLSSSPSIACRALHWYLRLKECTPTNSDTRYFIPFPIIFRKGLSADEKCESWSLLVDVLIPRLKCMPLEERIRFVENFFGYGSSQGQNQTPMDLSATRAGMSSEEKDLDTETPGSSDQADGFGWMEDVWITFLRPLVREVHISRAKDYWSELSRVMPEAYPDPAAPNEPNLSLDPSMSAVWSEADEGVPRDHGAGPTLKMDEEHLEASGRGVLGVLALLVEAGATLMPSPLLDRVRNSHLLSDERLCHDTESLSRLESVLSCNQGS